MACGTCSCSPGSDRETHRLSALYGFRTALACAGKAARLAPQVTPRSCRGVDVVSPMARPGGPSANRIDTGSRRPITSLRVTLGRWVYLYNHCILHEGLHYKTPIQTLQLWYAWQLRFFRKIPRHHPGSDRWLPCFKVMGYSLQINRKRDRQCRPLKQDISSRRSRMHPPSRSRRSFGNRPN